MILKTTDFDQIPYNVPNNDSSSFMPYVERKEKDILIELLGRSFYDYLNSQLALLPIEWSGTTAYLIGNQIVYGVSVWEALAGNTNVIPVEGINWTKLSDNAYLKVLKGDTYVYSGKLLSWDGLVDMLVPYVYSFWLRDTWDDHTKHGVVYRKVENAEVISPADRIVRAYNDFYTRYATLHYYLITNEASYTGSYDTVYYGSFVEYLGKNYVFPGKMNDFNL